MKPKLLQITLAFSLETVRSLLQRYHLPLTADEDFQHTTIEISYMSIFFYDCKQVEFCAHKIRSADSIDFCYHLKKTATESHRMLVEIYGEHALNKKHSASND